ncbi:ATP synthase F1 subunit gamma [bacterium]|nr:ATP synthase F1 subunit gamma [bacterium]
MAENLKVLRRRIRTVAGTKQVTRAMEMVSASKLRKAQNRLLSGRPFTQKIQEMLSHLLGAPGVGENPLFAERTAGRTLVVVITADRGLAGSFNARLLSAADEYLSQLPAGEAALYLIGKKGADYYRRHPRCEVVRAITDMGGNLSPERSAEITDELVGGFLSGRYKSVHIVFAHYVSTILSRPTRIKFLPLDHESLAAELAGGEEEERRAEYIFEPSPRAVFDKLLPAYLRSRVFMILAENFTSEHSARMVSMSNATRNCEEMLYDLTLRRNKARQASITKEMLEIVSGAEALK